MRKKTIPILLSFSLFLQPLLGQEAENPTAKLLREALFAEQADRDLATAEKGYREIIQKFETDRAYAATAILRLAEILHQRGDTIEAEKWFARVLQEFPDQEEITKVASARLGAKATKLLGTQQVRKDPQTEEIKRVVEILKQSPDLLDTPVKGITLLNAAAAKGQLEVIEFLLGKGARVNVTGSGSSALVTAVENGHLAVVDRLLKAKAKIEPDLLNKAVSSGNYAISELLLKSGANPNTATFFRLSLQEIKDSTSFPAQSDDSGDPFADSRDPFASSGDQHTITRTPENVFDSSPLTEWTPLEVATFYRFPKLANLLLANGAKPQKDVNGYSEDLRFALVDQNTKLVAKLLKSSADPDSLWHQRNGSFTALSIASILGNLEITKLLIDAGANVNLANPGQKNTPLFYAEGPTVALLLAAGANPNAKNKHGGTPLLEVTDPAKTKALLKAGADLNALIESGHSPLSFANPDVLDVLLATKPDLSKLQGQHTTLGHTARDYDRSTSVERIKKLIAAGANPNQVDKDNMTPLLLAIKVSSLKNVEALLKGGANPNGAPHSQAPLVCQKSLSRRWKPNQAAIVRALVDAGADPNALDLSNETILFKVAESNDLETVRYLLKKGANSRPSSKAAFSAAPDGSTTKTELFLATYLQPKPRRGTIRVVSPAYGHIRQTVSAFTPVGKELPKCPYTLLEAYANTQSDYISLGEVTIWREGKTTPMKVNLRNIIASADPKQDFPLAWGDLVEFRFSKSVSSPELAITEKEKKFLESHLHRQVEINNEGTLQQINLVIPWQNLVYGKSWRKSDTAKQLIADGTTKTAPIVSLQNIRLNPDDPFGETPKFWNIKRSDGTQIKVPTEQPLTLWLKNGDRISFDFQ